MATYIRYTRDLQDRVTGISWYSANPDVGENETPPAAFKVMGITYTGDNISRVIISENQIEISDIQYVYNADGVLTDKIIHV